MISSERTTNEYISLNNCGFHTFGHHDWIVNRPGRVDYYIIYIHSGRCIIEEDNKETEALSGDIVLYRPNEPQKYYFKAEDKTVSMFLHFTGTGCGELINKFNMSSGRIFHVGVSHTIHQLFHKLEYEFLLKKPFFNDYCSSIIYELLSTCARKLETVKSETRVSDNRILDICKLMVDDFSEWKPIKYYASQCNLSESRFSHIFKSQTGITPQEYIMSLRINKAKTLLSETDLPISKISDMLGFNTHNYFIRVFKKYTGNSPLKFKNSIL